MVVSVSPNEYAEAEAGTSSRAATSGARRRRMGLRKREVGSKRGAATSMMRSPRSDVKGRPRSGRVDGRLGQPGEALLEVRDRALVPLLGRQRFGERDRF